MGDSDGGSRRGVVVDTGVNTEPRPVGVLGSPSPTSLSSPTLFSDSEWGGSGSTVLTLEPGGADRQAGYTIQPWAPISLSFLFCNMGKEF